MWQLVNYLNSAVCSLCYFSLFSSVALNLGIPKSSGPASSSSANKPLQVVSSAANSTALPTSLHPVTHPAPHLDGTSSPNVITSFPSLITPAGAPYHATPMLHPSQQPFSTQPPLNSATTNSKGQSSGQGEKQGLKVSQDQETQGGKTLSVHSNTISAIKNAKHPGPTSSPITFTPNNMIVQNTGRGSNTASVNAIKHASVAKTTSGPVTAELPMGYIATSGHYQQIAVNKSFTKVFKDEATATGRNNKSGIKKRNATLCFVILLSFLLPLFV